MRLEAAIAIVDKVIPNPSGNAAPLIDGNGISNLTISFIGGSEASGKQYTIDRHGNGHDHGDDTNTLETSFKEE